jgi:hypothetical protein
MLRVVRNIRLMLLFGALAGVAGSGLSNARLVAQSDLTPPTVTVRSPATNATAVSPDVNVQATFSEPVQPATISIVLRNASNAIVPGVVSYDSIANAVTLDPSAGLSAATYTVTVSGARDLSSNLMASVSWSC